MESLYLWTVLALIVLGMVTVVQTVVLFRLMKQNQQLQQKIGELSDEAATDSLTGLLNRRSLDRALGHVFADRKRNPTEDRLTVLMIIDLDHFKGINDTCGHDVGDRALICLAKALQQVVRNEDVVARHGGDEFAIIATVHDTAALKTLVTKIRSAVAAISVPTTKDESIQLTISVGVSKFDSVEYAEPVDLMKAADLALYKTKQEGRNGCFLLNHGRGELIDLVH